MSQIVHTWRPSNVPSLVFVLAAIPGPANAPLPCPGLTVWWRIYRVSANIQPVSKLPGLANLLRETQTDAENSSKSNLALCEPGGPSLQCTDSTYLAYPGHQVEYQKTGNTTVLRKSIRAMTFERHKIRELFIIKNYNVFIFINNIKQISN